MKLVGEVKIQGQLRGGMSAAAAVARRNIPLTLFYFKV
jgi:hypothetical protein